MKTRKEIYQGILRANNYNIKKTIASLKGSAIHHFTFINGDTVTIGYNGNKLYMKDSDGIEISYK